MLYLVVTGLLRIVHYEINILYRGQMARTQAKYIVDEKGNRSAVVLPIEEYNEMLEDIHVLAVIAEQKKKNDTISPADLKKKI